MRLPVKMRWPSHVTQTLTVLLVTGCAAAAELNTPVCLVELYTIEPQTVQPGETVIVTGSPMTQTWDTALFVGTERLSVETITREGCEECDSCRNAFACEACGDCDYCDYLCEQSCVEQLQSILPDTILPGEQPLQMINTYGASDPLTLTVVDAEGGTDTGTSPTDTGASDSGMR